MTVVRILIYPLLIVSAMELLLGFLLLKNNPRNSPVNRSVAFFSVFSAAFALSTSVMYIRAGLGLPYAALARFSWIGWFTIPAAIQAVFYLQDERSRKARWSGVVLYAFWGLAFLLAQFTELVVPHAYRVLPFNNVRGPLENAFRVAGGGMIFWLMVEIVRLRRNVSGIKRAQLNYFLFGTIIFGTGGMITASIIQLMRDVAVEPGLASYFSFPWVLMTFYAITRYRLFDIRIVLSRLLNIILMSVMISALLFALFKFLSPSVGEIASIFISIPVIGVLLFGTPLSGAVQRWINEIVLRNQLTYQRMLKDSSTAMMTILHRDELLEYIMRRVRSGLGVDAARLYLKVPGGSLVSRERDIAAPGEEESASLPAEIVRHFERGPEPLIADEARTFPSSGREGIAATIDRLHYEIFVPLVSQQKLIGVLALGARRSGEPYFQSDIDLLQTLAGHAAAAIENARLFEEAGRMRASLKESEDIFRTLAETTSAAIFIHRGCKLLYANAATVRMTGYNVPELVSMDFWQIVHPAQRDEARDRGIGRFRGEPIAPNFEFKVLRKDGRERWVYLTAGAIEFDGRPAVIGTLVDITDLKLAEAEREQLYEERLSEQQRHQSEKERILKDLHDGIGGLTTNINLLAELARTRDDLGEVRRSLATIAELSRESLSEIRSFMQSLDVKDLRWPAVAAELRHLGSTIIEPHDIRFSLTTSLPEEEEGPSSATAMNLFRIYKESLANVVKHARASSVDVSLSLAAGRVRLTVRDDGVGLGGKRGTGRGLLNMQTRAAEMGGTVSIVSDAGTLVSLDIPVQEQNEVAARD
jgi:PAS domain S-box-containing protein